MAAQKKTLKLKRPDTTPAAPTTMQAGAPLAAGGYAPAYNQAGGLVRQKGSHYATFAILTIFSVLFMIAMLVTQWMEWDFFGQPTAAFHVPTSHELPFSLAENDVVAIPGWMVNWGLVGPTHAILSTIDKGGMALVYTAVGLAAFLSLLFIICLARLLTKAGKSGWLALVPFYNGIVFAQLAGRSGWWFVLLFVPFLNIAIYIDLMIGISRQYRKGAAFAAGMVFVPFLLLPMLAFGSTTHVDYEPPEQEEEPPPEDKTPDASDEGASTAGDSPTKASGTGDGPAAAAKTADSPKFRTVRKPALPAAKGTIKTIRKPAPPAPPAKDA